MINFDTFQKAPADFKEVYRLTVSDREMQKKKTVVKSKFYHINDKRFYFADRITSLPLNHPHLQRLFDFKGKKGQIIERYFWEEKETPIRNRKQGRGIKRTTVLVASAFDEQTRRLSPQPKRKIY